MKALLSFVLASMAMMVSVSTAAAAAVLETAPQPDGSPWNAIMAIGTVASVTLSVVSGGYTWLSNRDRVTADTFAKQHKEFNDRCVELERELHKQALKIAQLEGDLKAVPNNKQMGELYKNVSEIDGDMKAANATLAGIKEQMEGFNKTGARIEQFLLNQALEQSHGKGRTR